MVLGTPTFSHPLLEVGAEERLAPSRGRSSIHSQVYEAPLIFWARAVFHGTIPKTQLATVWTTTDACHQEGWA